MAVAAEPLSGAPQNAAGKPAQPTYTLRVTKEGITAISLSAQGAKLSDIAADLSKRLGARVIVGPTMANEPISATFSELPLEPALSALAPQVYIDYEIRQGAQPAPQGIYLLGYTDPPPAVNAVVRGASLGVLITGHTEETGKPEPDDPLQVLYDQSRLTIRSKEQPLAVVVTAIADTLGVPSEIKYGKAETVDTVIEDVPPEEAIPALSPHIRLYVRVDVSKGGRTLLRLAVLPPAAK